MNGPCIVNVSLQLWHKTNNKKRDLNKMPYDNKEKTFLDTKIRICRTGKHGGTLVWHLLQDLKVPGSNLVILINGTCNFKCIFCHPLQFLHFSLALL